ncbi:MAG: hypothetical protein IJK84_02235 [Bacteroidales bacterium]|nr:hypothetical protein [Bacteroidales bacterium]
MQIIKPLAAFGPPCAVTCAKPPVPTFPGRKPHAGTSLADPVAARDRQANSN